MRLKQFLYLKTVAECKSITKASEKLFISHQALSHALLKLEENYGIKLLVRTPQGVSLTHDGENFLEIANQILILNNQLESQFIQNEENINTLTGELKIIAANNYTANGLPDIQYQLRKKYPALFLSVTNGDFYTIVSEIENKTKDIGYIYNIALNDVSQINLPDSLVFIPLSCSHFAVAASKKLALSKKKSISLKCTLEYPIAFLETVVGTNSDDHILHNILSQYKENFDSFIANSESLYFKLLGEGDMIAIEPESYILHYMQAIYPQKITIIPLRDRLVAEVGYIVHKDMLDDPRIQAFLQMNATIYKDYLNINTGS